ncbi:DUF2520 domain-containing protein [Leptobacterium sp. I13]|uniref:Rossmann-like and DUF2520 domain-containing protein n=1 Tax=Leptobacterium meishanense TaxID=3128904 RepID=UPI0030EBDF71
MVKIVLIGAGNVAMHLYTIFKEHNAIDVVQWYSRSLNSIRNYSNEVAITNHLTDLKEADLYLLAVSDSAIGHIAKNLPFEDQLVVHTSGNISLEMMPPKNRRGVFYPLQTFSKEISVDFKVVPICIEAELQKDLALLEMLGSTISDHIYRINSEQRKALHLAAVFVNNFTNHLYYIGNKICEEHAIPFEVLQPLIKETARKVEILPPYEAQTGPARREDIKVIMNQIAMLKSKAYKNAYTTLTDAILETYGRQKL